MIIANSPIIAGVDPGTTTGIALLDLDGNIVLLKKGKNLSRAKIIKIISDYGSPVVIAGDVSPASKLIEKIAASFSSKIIIPEYSLSRKDKIESTKKFLEDSKKISRHERDALAAALYGWKKIRPVVRRVDKRLGNYSDTGLSSFVKTNVILNGKSITSSIKQYRELNIS